MIEQISNWFAHIDWVYQISLWKHFPGIVWNNFIQLAPYVLLGSLLGEFLKFTSWTKLIYNWVSKQEIVSIITATILGILSPLCTYGTVPVLITLYNAGVSIPPLISFLATSSMMNPQLFIMTCGGLGVEIALIQLLCVFIFGLLIGFITMLIPEKFIIRKKLFEMESLENRVKKVFALKLYFINVGKNLLFVGKMMLIGIGIASVVELMPVNLLIDKVDTASPFGIIMAAVAGIPMYACGGGVIPMISSLMSQGMSRGSAIAFLISGPATRITSLAAIAVILKKRFILFYVLILLMYAVAVGMFLI